MEIKLETLYNAVLAKEKELGEYIISTYGKKLKFREISIYKTLIARIKLPDILFKDCIPQFDDKNLLVALILLSEKINTEFEFEEDSLIIRLNISYKVDRTIRMLYFDELNILQLKQLLSLCIMEQISFERNNRKNVDYDKEIESKCLEYTFDQMAFHSKQKYLLLFNNI